MGYPVVAACLVHLVSMVAGHLGVNVRSDLVIPGVEITLNAVGAAASMEAKISV